MPMKYLKIFLERGGKIMSSIRRITASTPVPDDLANRLGPSGIKEILFILWEGYRELKADPHISITSTALEDDITLEWYLKIFYLWTSKSRATTIKLVPVHQYPDPYLKKGKGYSPTIDFCFRDWDTSNSYFGVECKNLYDNNFAKVKRYVETGVVNYTKGRYGSQSTKSSIVGYVLSGRISEILKDLKKEVDKESPIMNLTRDLSTLYPQYYSQHMRISDKKVITLYHLFFDFAH